MTKNENGFDKQAIIEMVKGIDKKLTFDEVLQALTKKRLDKKKKKS